VDGFEALQAVEGPPVGVIVTDLCPPRHGRSVSAEARSE
jgi:hypothetical protein